LLDKDEAPSCTAQNENVNAQSTAENHYDQVRDDDTNDQPEAASEVADGGDDTEQMRAQSTVSQSEDQGTVDPMNAQVQPLDTTAEQPSSTDSEDNIPLSQLKHSCQLLSKARQALSKVGQPDVSETFIHWVHLSG